MCLPTCMCLHLRSLDLHVLENGRHFANLVLEVWRSVDVHFQGSEEGTLLHASQELGLRLLPLAATGKVLVEKGVDVFLLVGPFFMIPLALSDRHHRQIQNTLRALPLVLRSLLPFLHEVQELDGLRRAWIRLGAGELLSGQPTSMAMAVTAVKLVGSLAGSNVAIHR